MPTSVPNFKFLTLLVTFFKEAPSWAEEASSSAEEAPSSSDYNVYHNTFTTHLTVADLGGGQQDE